MKKLDDCKYSSMIECQPSGRNCERCGWNPAVREERLRRAMKTQSYKVEVSQKCAS